MQSRQFIIFGAWMLCIILALVGGTMPPLNELGLVEVILYEFTVIVWLSLLMGLIYRKALPNQ